MASKEANGDSNAPVATTPAPSKTREIFAKFTQYFRLLVYAEPSKREILLLCVGLVASIAAGVPFPMLGILFGQLMDDLNTATCNAGTQGAASAAAYQAAVNDKVLKVVYISIASFVLIYTYILSWNLAGERLAQRLRAKYFKSLLRQEASFFDKLAAGEVSSRLNGDIQLIQAGTSEKVGIYVATLSFFVTSYVIAFIKDAKLAGTLISLVPCFFAMSLVGGHYIKKFAGRMSDYSAKASSLASEALSSMTIVHAFGANKKLEKKFSENLQGTKKEGIYKAVTTSIQSGLLYFIAFSANALAFWMGSRTIADAVGYNREEASVGTTYTVIFLLVDATLMLSQVAPFLQIFGSAAAAFEKLEKDINHRSSIDGTEETKGIRLSPDTIKGHIQLRDVSFIYPSRPDTIVLQKISVDCPAGKHTAIVGLSGSGKSTIAGLATRLYDPTEGTVLLDGQNLREINVRSLRGYISLVQQEPSLLDRSILENIALGLINSPRHAHLKDILMTSQLSEIAEILRMGNDTLDTIAASRGAEITEIIKLVRDAAEQADALNFINRLEHGFATSVGSSGGSLVSGGQKQRIAVARALIRDPAVLILDEATAALDSASEQRIMAAIEKAAEGRTLISIAHRLATIKNADNIIVMGQGGYILEQGTHSELIAKDGSYAGLVRLQSMNTEKNDDGESSTIGAGKSSLDGSFAAESIDEKKPHADEHSTAPSTPSPDAAKEEKPISTLEMIGKVGSLLRPYFLFLMIAFCGATVVGGTYPSSAVIFGHTVGSLSPCNSEDYIRERGNLFGLMFFILAIAEFFANFASWSMFGTVAEKILYKVQVLAFRSLLEQDIQWHTSEGRSPASLLGFITKDASALGSLTGSIIGTIFGIIVNLLAAIILTHIIAWRIALVCLAVVPLLLGAGYMQLRALTGFAEKHAGAFAKSIGITVEAVNSIKTISALSLEHEIATTYRRSLAGPRKEITFASAYANLWLAIAYGIGNFVYALAYWWGAKQIVAGNSTQTQFFIVLLAMLVSVQLWAQMFTLMPEVSRAFSAAGRILKLLEIGSAKDIAAAARSLDKSDDIESTAPSTTATEKSPSTTPIKGAAIRFDNVSFTYPSRPDNPILNSLSLSIAPGQFVALVGPSGAGKSTIISLIERLYNITDGTITIDGLDISRADTTFRDDIALVPQDSVLFDASIAFNLSLGARSGHTPSQEEMEEACRIANIHDVITALPDGYNTPCGPNGRLLSGGQRQRVAMARALVRRPKLLLLDESTSALDAESERAVSEGLERVVKETGCTVVVIAHRLVTVRKADCIVVVEDGRVVDQGRHEELAERCEGYRVNVMHQAVDA